MEAVSAEKSISEPFSNNYRASCCPLCPRASGFT